MRFAIVVFLTCNLVLLRPSASPADDAAADVDTLRALAPRVYIDCDDCDPEYLREEIGFVNFVRDRQNADVHILVSEITTGSGGTEYTVEFIGQGPQAGCSDTLRVTTLATDSDDAIRRELARVIRLGMARHAARTPLARYLSVQYDRPRGKDALVDRWDYWVFEVSGNSYLNGEDSYHYTYFYGELEARRVTEATKTYLAVYASYSDTRFDYTVDEVDVSVLTLSRSRGLSASRYYSLTDHWSAGGAGSIYASTYSNRDFDATFGPSLEYNLFPYQESTRRQCRLIYKPRLTYVDYTEETLFDRQYEWLSAEHLTVVVEAVQPWGNISSEVTGSHYFHDFSKNQLYWYGEISLNLVKGLSLSLQGNVSRVRNLLSLPKGGASEEEVLLRIRQLETSYQYWASIGISYSFGSIYNNVVNPRFGN